MFNKVREGRWVQAQFVNLRVHYPETWVYWEFRGHEDGNRQ